MSDDNNTGLTRSERRATWSLALIYMVRMIGLFIILPVFSLFGSEYTSSTPLLIGLAIGIYGLLQAALQIPFGMLSDHIGRKRVITVGLLLLIAGSVIAALADDIRMVILGRALQGAGAISSVLMALAADLTREEQRTKIMATLGASIGFAFILALIAGPVLIGWFSIDVLFWVTAGCGVLALILLHFVVPEPVQCHYSSDTGANVATMRRLLSHRELLRLDASVFVLHLLITATFFAVPLALLDAGVEQARQWIIYLPAVLLSLALMVPLVIVAEKRAMRGVMLLAVVGLLVSQLVLGFVASTAWTLALGVLMFFAFLSTLEALLPSLVSRLAPAAAKGSAMGIYSSSQFLGAFVGGTGAGWLYGSIGGAGLYAALAALCALWLLIIAGFRAPARLATHRELLSDADRASPDSTITRLRALPGVEEVALAIDEGVAYLKVDKQRFRAAQITPESVRAPA